ncbi:hypothetical protein IZY60_15145 [Lutibacter sp. B2]|nr:hypothetical protein [Lutibacter sp. B2]
MSELKKLKKANLTQSLGYSLSLFFTLVTMLSMIMLYLGSVLFAIMGITFSTLGFLFSVSVIRKGKEALKKERAYIKENVL